MTQNAHAGHLAEIHRRFGALRQGIPFFVPVATILVFLLRRDYGFGFSDQDEIIPYLLQLLDASLFTADWFVAYQSSSFGPRTGFVWLMLPLAKLLGMHSAFLLVYLASFAASACAVYALAHELLRDKVAAAASVAAVMLLTPKFTLGGNDLIASMLTPSVAAWSLALWSIVLFVRGRPVRSAVLAGLATWLQALVGLQAALLLGVLLLWSGFRSRTPYIFALAYASVALPALAPIAVQQLLPTASAEGPGLFYTLFEFRAPHHYLFTSFTRISAAGFGMLVVLGLAGYRFVRSHMRADCRRFVMRSLVVVACAGVISIVGTEVVPLSAVAKLQLFKMTVSAKVILAVLFCGAVARGLPRGLRAVGDALMDHSHYVSAATFLAAATLLTASPTVLGLRPEPVPPLESWARRATPQEAIFAVPPSWDGFRSRAHRAILINYKAFPFLPGLEAEWLERLTAAAPITLPERGYASIQDSLDQAFLRLPASDLRALWRRYGVRYFVRNQELSATDFEVAYEDGPWRIYRIKTENRP